LLWIENADTESIAEIGELEDLQSLVIEPTSATHLSSLGRPHNLRRLYVFDAASMESLDFVAALRALYALACVDLHAVNESRDWNAPRWTPSANLERVLGW
jgi:hypothetical protein